MIEVGSEGHQANKGASLLIEKLLALSPGSSDPPEKIFNIFASENEVHTNY